MFKELHYTHFFFCAVTLHVTQYQNFGQKKWIRSMGKIKIKFKLWNILGGIELKEKQDYVEGDILGIQPSNIFVSSVWTLYLLLYQMSRRHCFSWGRLESEKK